MSQDSGTQAPPQTAREAKILVSRVIEESSGPEFSARAVLERFPVLEQFPTCVIDLAYEEYSRSRDAGQQVAASQFVRGFSLVEQSLIRVIELDQMIRENPDVLQEVPEERWPEEGDEFCGCYLEEEIGRGALSRVFVARQTRLGMRQVVLKICIRGDREAELLGQLEFEGIVPIHSIHTDRVTGLTAICMPYVTRMTMHGLAEILFSSSITIPKLNGAVVANCVKTANEHGGLTAPQSGQTDRRNGIAACRHSDRYSTLLLKWGIQIANALEYAHHRGVLHCDVKPGNVLILPDLSASVLDFNLASADGQANRWAGGTLPFMASEQLDFLLRSFQSDSPTEILPDVAETTDVYGLCATLWQMATGRPPFGTVEDCETRTEAANLLLKEQSNGLHPEILAETRRRLPVAAVDVLVRGLSRDPKDRPQSVRELAEALRRLLPDPDRVAWRTPPAVVVGIGITAAAIVAAVALRTDTTPDSQNAAILSSQTDDAGELLSPAILEAYLCADRGELDEAASLVEGIPQSDPHARFIRSYHTSCRLAPPAYGDASALRNQQAILNRQAQLEKWNEVAVEWLSLTTVKMDNIAAVAWFNLACVYLESEQYDASEGALKNAGEFGFRRPEAERVQQALKVAQAAKAGNRPDEDDVKALTANIREGGTRGEFLAFLHAAVLDLTQHPSQNERIRCASELVELMEKTRLLGPEATSVILRLSHNFPQPILKARLGQLHRDAAASPESLNRLTLLLALPDIEHLESDLQNRPLPAARSGRESEQSEAASVSMAGSLAPLGDHGPVRITH